jgi:hypothetical protein
MDVELAPDLKRCRVCKHRATGGCPNCGGALGMPNLGLPPCTVCPHGRLLAQDIDDVNAEMNEQYVIAQEQTVLAGFQPEVYVFDYDGFATGEVVNPDTLEAIALSNQMRIMQINNMLQSNPERIPAVEAVLGISGYMGS